MWEFRDLPLHKMRILPTLISFSVLPILPFLQLFGISKLVHMWPQLDNQACTWFPWRQRLEPVCEFFSPSLSLLHHIKWCESHWSTKREKNKIMWEVVARSCSAKKLSWKFHKTHREVLALGSLSNTVKSLQGIRFGTLLKRDSATGILKAAVRRCSTK